MAPLLTPRPAGPAEGVHFVENFFGNGLITTNNVGQNDFVRLCQNQLTLHRGSRAISGHPSIGGLKAHDVAEPGWLANAPPCVGSQGVDRFSGGY